MRLKRSHISKCCINLLLLIIFICNIIPQPISAKNKKKKKIKKSLVLRDTAKIHSPTRAFIYSIVPGLGQAYNKKYWKIPIVYAAIGASFYAARWNNKFYKRYRYGYIDYTTFLTFKNQRPTGGLPIPRPESERYRRLLDEDFDNFTPEQDQWFLTTLKNRRDGYKRDRDLWYIITTGFYILNIIDAVVDAHLMYFDVSDDLSMQIKPCLQLQERDHSSNLGLTLILTF